MLQQITTIPETDYYLDFHSNTFKNYEPLAKIDNLTLVQQLSENAIEYGLLDEQNRVAGYFRIVKFNDEIWETTSVTLAHAYTGCGYGSFFHDFLVMNQKKKINIR